MEVTKHVEIPYIVNVPKTSSVAIIIPGLTALIVTIKSPVMMSMEFVFSLNISTS